MRMRTVGLPLCTCLVLACGGDGGGPSGPTATISGTVTNAASGAVVAGATVSLGSMHATSDASGRFELGGVLPGASVGIECVRAGFVAYSAEIAVQAGSNSHDILLTAQEIYVFSDFAVFVPASATQVRGVIVALGGPDTRAFVDGRPATDELNQDLEHALQGLGQQLRALARDSGFAVVGSGSINLPNDAASDARVLGSLQTAAAASGRPELASAPLMTVGLSSGGAVAFGLAERQAARVATFALVVPVRLVTSVAAAARSVPGYIALHELDPQVTIPVVTQEFLGNRAAGALWSLAIEPDQTHQDLSYEAQTALVHWINTAAGLRLPASPGGALRSVEESSGWLGNRATFEVAPYASYGGNPLQASWLPTEATATDWSELNQ